MTALAQEKIAGELKDVPDWTLHGKAITRTFKLDGF